MSKKAYSPVQDTIKYHPQADKVMQAYSEAFKLRSNQQAKLLEELGMTEDSLDVMPRPFVYFLPTGNEDFDSGIDYITPNKDTKFGITGGGFAVGKITAISGRSGVGKSQFVYNLCKKAKFKTLYIDTEGGIIDEQIPNVVVYNTEILEQCWRLVMKAIDSGKFNCIVIDSLTNLKTRNDMQKEDGEMPKMGEKSQVMNSFLTKLVAKLMTNDVAVIIISQERESFDLFRKDPVLPGGASVLYATSMIMGLLSNKSDEIKDKSTGLKVGQKTKVKIRKNRYGADNCEFVCKIMFDGGK